MPLWNFMVKILISDVVAVILTSATLNAESVGKFELQKLSSFLVTIDYNLRFQYPCLCKQLPTIITV